MPTVDVPPLSAAAERLLDDMAGRVGAKPSLSAWLAELSAIGDAVAAAAGMDPADVQDLIATWVSRGGQGTSLSPDQIAEQAGRLAASGGRPVTSTGDIVRALLDLAAAGTPTVRTPDDPAGEARAATVTAGPAWTPQPLRAAEQRVVRVFVSSTFSDMQPERDELVKRTFPQLRKLCESRGVTWGEVDLRWGITDEQKADGAVLPICLAEIDRCRPYFIALLGERYGWVPDEIDPALVAREPWLAQHHGASVTELEIQYGALRDPSAAEEAFFYLRKPDHLSSLPQEQQTARRVRRAPPDRPDRLEALKASILASGLPARSYPDPEALGRMVLTDLTGVIDRLYPEGSAPDPLEREAGEHEDFARARARVYVGRRSYMQVLDAHADGDGPPLAVIGASGSGKSALLANWALSYREQHADQAVVMHFVGSSSFSSDWIAMVRRIMAELGRRLGIAGTIPDDVSELRPAFANWLHMAAARGRVILVIDALNQLDDRDGAPDLVWLPQVVPPALRLVVSTLPGRSQDELSRRRWPTLEVQPLTPEERQDLTRSYLAQYDKQLSPSREERLAAAEQCANPLFLRVLLEQLRQWGEHETLDDQIDHYLAASSLPHLYRLVLSRWQTDFERDRPGLVADATSLLWAARRGLSEAELLELLGADGAPLPAAQWSPFALAAEQALAQRAGLTGYAHDYLRAAVRDAYLPTEDDRRRAHARLAQYFDLRRELPRALDELPWQLAAAGSWRRLRDLLVDGEFLTRAWPAHEYDVKSYWTQIEAASPERMIDAYRPVVEDPASYDETMRRGVQTLLAHTGHEEDARVIAESLIAAYRDRGDRAGLAAALGELGFLLEAQDPARSIATFREQEEIAGSIGDSAAEANALIGQAAALIRSGELDRAGQLLERQAQLARESGDLAQLHLGLGNRAVVHAMRREFDVADLLLREKERVARQIGDLAGVVAALENRAVVTADRGDPAASVPLFERAAELARSLGDRPTLLDILLNHGRALIVTGRPHDAVPLLRDAVEIARELGAPIPLQMAEKLLRASGV